MDTEEMTALADSSPGGPSGTMARVRASVTAVDAESTTCPEKDVYTPISGGVPFNVPAPVPLATTDSQPGAPMRE